MGGFSRLHGPRDSDPTKRRFEAMRRCSILVVIAIIQFAAAVPINSDDSQVVRSYEGPGEGLGDEDEDAFRRLHVGMQDYDIIGNDLSRRKRFGKELWTLWVCKFQCHNI